MNNIVIVRVRVFQTTKYFFSNLVVVFLDLSAVEIFLKILVSKEEKKGSIDQILEVIY